MKTKITSLLLAAGSLLSLNAQMLLQEDFTSPFNSVTAGWVRINNSTSANGTWVQGVGTTFPAFNGGPNDYYTSGYANSSSTATNATLSNWLITPTLNLTNGGIIQFATRTSSNPTTFPDRLEVYMSSGVGTNVGTTPTSLGTFSTLLVTVNPNLSTTGYPNTWTIYTATLSGLGGPGAGRIGFRYHVTNGGPNGANSDQIGIDAVRYWNPCGLTVPNYTICAGTSATLTGMNGAPPITYTWSPGSSNNSSIVVTPVSTSVYTLNYSESGNPCPAVTSTVTIGNQLSLNLTASAASVCPSQAVTFTAQSAATSYTWLPAASNSSVATYTVNTTTTYSVAAQNGFCFGGGTVNVFTFPSPTVSIAASNTLVCLNASSTTVTYTGNGASTYVWVLGAQQAPGSTITLNVAAPNATTAAVQTLTLGLVGFNQFGCGAASIHTLTIGRTPTISVAGATSAICAGESVNLTASGSSSVSSNLTYSWSNGGNTATTSYSNANSGTYTVTVVGTNSAGCSSPAAATTVSVSGCVGIQKIDANTINGNFFPNPFAQQLIVTGFTGVVEVFNTTGQLVIRANVNGSETINTSELSKGIYIVQGYNVNGELTKTEKLIKN